MSLLFLQLSSTKLGSTFESTAELNYFGRPKLVLGSAHMKFLAFESLRISLKLNISVAREQQAVGLGPLMWLHHG